MVIVSGRLPIRPEARDALLEAVGPLLEATRAEPGCVRYDFAFDVQDPSTVHFIEVWEDQDALQAHFRAPHFAAFNQAVPAFVAGGADLSFWSAEPLDLPTG